MAKKATKSGFSVQGFDAAAVRQSEAFAQAVSRIFLGAVNDFSRLASRLNIDKNKPFSFNDYPTAKREASKFIAGMSKDMKAVVLKATEKQWLLACEKNNAFIGHILKTSAIPDKILRKYQDRSLDALESFQNRKTNGLGLSDRIWKYTDQFKTQMELGIDIGIGDGLSAADLSRDLRKYLVDPDKLFRRVRDKHGNLVLSKAAKAFSPGQGKYRSSYKNAMRLTRTEINMAYRASDQARWEKLDFVIGYEVKLSNNHTLNGVPFVDICDELKGKYPKDFVFSGWHVQCRCMTIPILISQEGFDTDELNELKAAINGTEYNKFVSKDAVTDVPKGFKDWVKNNAERSKGWKSQPFFIRDNFKGGKVDGGLKLDKEYIAKSSSNKNTTTLKEKDQDVKSSIKNRIPDKLSKDSGYLKGMDFEFDNDFFSLIDENKFLELNIDKKENSYFSIDSVRIGNGKRLSKSRWQKKAVVYHEFGHAIDAQRGLSKGEAIANIMSKHRAVLSSKTTYTRFVRDYDLAKKDMVNVKTTSTVSKYAEATHKLDSLHSKVVRMSESTFVKRGITKNDVLEQIGSAQDTIMSLNSNYGYGHSKAYFKKAGMKEAEFIAHAFENAFLGNEVFKKYLPDLYADMIAYIKAIK